MKNSVTVNMIDRQTPGDKNDRLRSWTTYLNSGYSNSVTLECEVQLFTSSVSPQSQRVGKSQAHFSFGFYQRASVTRHTLMTAKNIGESNLQTNTCFSGWKGQGGKGP